MTLASTIRSIVKDADADANITHLATRNQVIAETQATPRYYTVLLSVFAIVGTTLALLGVLLTTSFSVSQRARELSIRICCGATPFDIVRLVVLDQLKQIVVGMVVGGFVCFAMVNVVEIPWESAKYFRIVAWTAVPFLLAIFAVLSSLAVAMRLAFRVRVVI